MKTYSGTSRTMSILTVISMLFLFLVVQISAAPTDQGETEEVVSAAENAGEMGTNDTLVYNEVPCLRGGGTCLPEIECPPGSLSAQRGLCPAQQDNGVECCHGLSLLETRCQARGGQCTDISSCSRALVEDRAEDCPDAKVCCVLVRF